ncbi:diguanylate cyclase/phosphodiesterase (GGDEF & EAL domains) with PAS/PAC sensor(s) [Moritella sp. JT01]|uniref:GGDEF domain-containing protein n=1 Tax=Moritella sp. JT01 TaxID=756698 RepID=UPI00079321C8|nr:GGDEF domain-containing protein [Moritella sp. JT01]KXO13714.1 diguanylate cyclase/phosphodiesterase (GGDEF & EAL domains) with PAS/PAC sensor(s) [Moritella sp. JT01]
MATQHKQWIVLFPVTFIKYAIFITLTLSFSIGTFTVRAEYKTEHVRILLPPTSIVQSAGYYMAQHKGFFSAQGFNADLISMRSHQSISQAVDQGEAEYGVTNADVLIAKANGRALVAIAAIFQHSPSALLVLKNKGMNKLADLNDKRVLLLPEFKDIEVLSLLRKQHIHSINILSPSVTRDITTLVNNQFDALSINLTRGPYNAVRQGVEPIIFMPKDYGIDFYSGFLFTSVTEASLNPERVAAVRTAVLQGWEYALTHTEETLDVLVALNQPLPSAALDVLRNQFKYQLITMRDYILPDFVPLGYINRQHLVDIQQQLIDLNFISQGSDFSQFIYTPPRAKIDWQVWGVWVKVIVVALLFNGLWLFYLLIINQRLKREVLERRRAEQQVRYAAMHDNLTGLANRAQLMETLEHILPLAKKGKITPVLLFMDLDRFKLVNDRYGHAAGDELLIAAAQRMSRLLGAPGELLTRLGGDEFVVLLTNSNLRYAGQLSEQIERTLLQSFALSVCNVSIGISIGYNVYQHDMSADELLTGADNQMYEIKSEHHQKRKQIVC